jgi:hypothetical protein
MVLPGMEPGPLAGRRMLAYIDIDTQCEKVLHCKMVYRDVVRYRR